MNRELEVGMYVRTKDGKISKIKDINNFIYTDKQRYGKHYVIKSSYNPIDLIEVGDYLNGYKVIEIIKDFKVIVDKSELNTSDGNYYLKSFTNNQIKDIVTKEQFETMKYIIEK